MPIIRSITALERAEVYAQRVVLIALLEAIRELKPELYSDLKRKVVRGHVKPSSAELEDHPPISDELVREKLNQILAEVG